MRVIKAKESVLENTTAEKQFYNTAFREKRSWHRTTKDDEARRVEIAVGEWSLLFGVAFGTKRGQTRMMGREDNGVMGTSVFL